MGKELIVEAKGNTMKELCDEIEHSHWMQQHLGRLFVHGTITWTNSSAWVAQLKYKEQ